MPHVLGTHARRTPGAAADDRAQWEADKRQQRQVERLKARATQLADDLDKTQAQATQYREHITKLERDKTALAKKLKRMDAVLMNPNSTVTRATTPGASAAAAPSARGASPPPATSAASAAG